MKREQKNEISFAFQIKKKEKGSLGTGSPLCTCNFYQWHCYSLLVSMDGFCSSHAGASFSGIHNFRRKASLPFK